MNRCLYEALEAFCISCGLPKFNGPRKPHRLFSFPVGLSLWWRWPNILGYDFCDLLPLADASDNDWEKVFLTECLYLLLLALHLGSWHCDQLLWIPSLAPRPKRTACSHHLGEAVQILHVLLEESNQRIKQQDIRSLSEKRSICYNIS